MQNGVTIWFTGLSGAGKTTLSKLVEEKLKQSGVKVEVLDGDILRQNLTLDLGFSRADRMKNIALATYIAKLLTRNGVIVLASFITPYQEMRDYCRREIGSLIEVYVKCPLSECIRRDAKGLYAKALRGEIAEFTGVSDPFEEPVNPEIVVETNKQDADQCALKIVSFVQKYIQEGANSRWIGKNF